MSAKVRIKAGPVEFEYEGETELSIDDIKGLFTHIETLFTVPVLAEKPEAAPEGAPSTPEHVPASAVGTKLHVNSIATKLGGKTGSDLAVAAAAYLQLNEGRESFSRQELLTVMKKATLHYNKNMSSNLTSIIKPLLGSKFNQIGEGSYSLTAPALESVKASLA